MPLYSYESVCDVRCNLNRHESGLSNIVTRNMHQKRHSTGESNREKKEKKKGETVYGNLYFNPNTLSSLSVRGMFAKLSFLLTYYYYSISLKYACIVDRSVIPNDRSQPGILYGVCVRACSVTILRY